MAAGNLRLLDCKVNGEEKRMGLDERERRVGVVSGVVMAAAIAIAGIERELKAP